MTCDNIKAAGDHALHHPGQYRRRSDLDAAAELRELIGQVLPVDLGRPDRDDVQRHRHQFEQAAGGEIGRRSPRTPRHRTFFERHQPGVNNGDVPDRGGHAPAAAPVNQSSPWRPARFGEIRPVWLTEPPRSFIMSVYRVFKAAAYDGSRLQPYSVNRHVEPLGQVLQRAAGVCARARRQCRRHVRACAGSGHRRRRRRRGLQPRQLGQGRPAGRARLHRAHAREGSVERHLQPAADQRARLFHGHLQPARHREHHRQRHLQRHGRFVRGGERLGVGAHQLHGHFRLRLRSPSRRHPRPSGALRGCGSRWCSTTPAR